VQGVSACVCVPIAPTVIPCALGCAADGQSCAGPGGSRGEGCDPTTCEQPDVPISDPRCVFRPDDQQWIIERDYDHWECSSAVERGGDDATCVEMMITKFEEACPNGCAPDGQSCAPGGDVPAAPADFLALESPGGTYFEWTDNSLNEDGFKIYFGGVSVGRPGQLIATTGPDVQTLDTDFVRFGTEICWEIYAFNSAGDSAPAWYCLPP
jgi:hypothetical protein